MLTYSERVVAGIATVGSEPDKEVVQQFVARLRRQILQAMEEAKATEPAGLPSQPA